MPAYCIEPHLPGVGGEAGLGAYQVTVNDLVTDDRLLRVLMNGYPFRTPYQMRSR
ncbi:MAG: thioester domain-containing protein [Oscillospiraceae bacterium]|nr:thioester domain-containing protein [Oscillospiraceae bacterium]